METFSRMADHLERTRSTWIATKVDDGRIPENGRQTEKFIGQRKANQMLTRDYRKPYVVPEKV